MIEKKKCSEIDPCCETVSTDFSNEVCLMGRLRIPKKFDNPMVHIFLAIHTIKIVFCIFDGDSTVMKEVAEETNIHEETDGCKERFS